MLPSRPFVWDSYLRLLPFVLPAPFFEARACEFLAFIVRGSFGPEAAAGGVVSSIVYEVLKYKTLNKQSSVGLDVNGSKKQVLVAAKKERAQGVQVWRPF